MKRIITYISILAAVLTAGVSCTRETPFDDNQDNGKITLRFRTEKMGTRVSISDPGNPATVAGEGAENTITHLDYFFFDDDDPESEAIVSGRLSVDDLDKVSDTEYTYDGFDTEDSDYEDLKGPSYLYVLVNYPSEVTATKMSELLALPISSDFTKAQTSFVMDSFVKGTESGLIYLTPKSNAEERDVEVNLSRIAAKLVLNVNVKKEFEDAAGNVWTPVTNQMWVNFLYSRKNTTVAAEPVPFDEKDNFCNTAQETPTSVTAVDANHTSWVVSPVYTYPQEYVTSDVTAPYFKIFCPWTCEKKGLNNFYYKIILPELGTFQRNKIYNLTVDLSVIGGTEDDWALVSDHIYVADWWAPDAIESSFEGAMYLDLAVKRFEIYGVDDVYIPVRSSNDIQITNITGTKTNLYNGQSVSVSGSTSEVSKEGFKFTHTLNNDITSSNFDCTPITFTMTVKHTTGGLSKQIQVTVVQYPSIYAEADESNGYAYVNSYAHSSISGGRHAGGYSGGTSNYAYNSRGNNTSGSDVLGVMNYLGQQSSQNNNGNQYVVTVSVLPDGYKVAGMTEDAVIGDPRGGRLTYNYLGYYGNGANGSRTLDVQSKYNGVSTSTQNVIAPSLRIASSWGATTTISYSDRAEERCAAYQENGYPAGRWRVPTVAEIDFLIRLSTYEHIPALFTTSKESTGNYGGGTQYYSGYWANGPSVYLGKPYTDDGNTAPYIANSLLTVTNTQSNGGYLLRSGTNNNNYRYYEPHVRCVYDEWYWSDQKYGNQGTASATAATQWIGYDYEKDFLYTFCSRRHDDGLHPGIGF